MLAPELIDRSEFYGAEQAAGLAQAQAQVGQVECSERRQAEVNTFRFGGRIQIRACRPVRHLLFMPRLISIQGTIRAAKGIWCG